MGRRNHLQIINTFLILLVISCGELPPDTTNYIDWTPKNEELAGRYTFDNDLLQKINQFSIIKDSIIVEINKDNTFKTFHYPYTENNTFKFNNSEGVWKIEKPHFGNVGNKAIELEFRDNKERINFSELLILYEKNEKKYFFHVHYGEQFYSLNKIE